MNSLRSEGRSIPGDFLPTRREPTSRDLEQRALEDLVGVCGIVLSTGRRLVLRPANRETLKRIGIVAWLDADPEILFERAMRSGRRPLLQTEDPKETFHALLKCPAQSLRDHCRFSCGFLPIESR